MNGTYRKRGDSWELRVMTDLPDGSHLRKAFCRRTKALAKAAYEQWLENGRKQAYKRQTVASWGDEWLEIKEASASYRTFANYKLYWSKHIKPAPGKMQLSKVKPVDVEKLLASAAHMRKSARHHVYITINQIMESAVQNDLCAKNPCRGISIGTDDPIKAVDVFTPSEIQTIVQDLSHPFGLAIALMLYANLRSEEVMGLRRGDIDQQNQIITVRRVVTRISRGEYTPVERTKNGKVRYNIPYGAELAAQLKQAQKTSIYAVPALRGGYMIPGSFRRQYENFFSGLAVRKLSTHKCRHTYATYLVLRSVQTILGHQSINVTEIYTHVNVDDQRRATDKLAY